MADNIKIIGNIVGSTTVSRYNTSDSNLIASQNIQENFGQYADYIEYYIYDTAGNLLNTSYRNYMNRFRYYADEMGRNISIRLKMPII